MDLYLLLLGKTGTGKSGTGNSILGCPAFISSACATSVTFDSRKELSVTDDGRSVYVVDTPGLADTRQSQEEGRNMFRSAITEAISMSPNGYDALIYVLRYDDRFTKLDVEVLDVLKQYFGDNFIEKHTVVVLTRGDNFKENEGEEMTFFEWCRKQKDHFKQIFEAVDGRVVLFDNTKKCSEEDKSEQRKKLLHMVDTLRLRGCRYTNKKFEKAQRHYEKVVNEEKAKFLNESIRDQTSKILAQLEKIEREDVFDIQSRRKALDELEGQLLPLQVCISEAKCCDEFLSESRQIVSDMLDKIRRNKTYLGLLKEIEEEKKRAASIKSRKMEEKIAQLEKAQKTEADERKKLRKSFNRCRDQGNALLHWRIVQELTNDQRDSSRVSDATIVTRL